MKNKNNIAIVTVLLIVIATLVGYIFVNNGNKEKNNTLGVMIDTSAVDEREKIEETTKDSPAKKDEELPGVVMPGWGSIALKSGTKNQEVSFFNPEENDGYYYLTFEICVYLDGNSPTSIYQSKLIPAGKYLYEIEINQELEAGVYDGYIHVQPYLMDGKTAVNNANMNLKIVVD